MCPFLHIIHLLYPFAGIETNIPYAVYIYLRYPFQFPFTYIPLSEHTQVRNIQRYAVLGPVYHHIGSNKHVLCNFLCRVFNADVKGFDCGDEAATWLTSAVNDGVVEGGIRLLYHGNLSRERKAREPAYYSFPQYKASDRVSLAVPWGIWKFRKVLKGVVSKGNG